MQWCLETWHFVQISIFNVIPNRKNSVEIDLHLEVWGTIHDFAVQFWIFHSIPNKKFFGTWNSILYPNPWNGGLKNDFFADLDI